MREASRIVLGGLELGSDAKLVLWPERYADKRGEVMWATVMRLIQAVPTARASAAAVPVAGAWREGS